MDISGDLHVSNKIIAKDISISGLFETATPVFSDISLTNYKDASFGTVDISGSLLVQGDISCNTLNYNNLQPEITAVKDTIEIIVNGGNTNSPYYTFIPDITQNYTFIKGNKYIFTRNAADHPFYISDIGRDQLSNELIISGDGSPTDGIINGESLNVIIPNNYSDTSFVYYCTVHSAMVDNNVNVGNANILSRTQFGDISNLTISSDTQDLSSIFYQSITPTRTNSKIIVNVKLSYFCSVAYGERINIQLWRDNILLSNDENLGTINATGGFTNSYNINYIDNVISNNNYKYYIKYKLENNDSQIPQGIININTQHIDANINGSSSIILYEL